MYVLIHDVTETFFADFNYGKAETKQLMPFCKISVEKYLFDKLYDSVFEMYKYKYQKVSAGYKDKVKNVLEKQDCVSQFVYLDVKYQFISH